MSSMNQWDKKPTMTVVYGEDIPRHVLQQVGLSYVGNEASITPVSNQDVLVYKADSMNGLPHIYMAIAGIEDHIVNVPLLEWATPLEEIEIIEDEEPLYVSVYKGKYFGQNCKATVYVVTI